MFSGLVKEIAKVGKIKRKSNIYLFCVKTESLADKAEKGDSIAVNGVCLTVVDKRDKIIYFDVMGKTFNNTNLRFLKKGDLVNTEEALRAGDKIGGHFVQGHVDCVVDIKKIEKTSDGLRFVLNLDKEIRPFIILKGSVALDGVSLTIQEVSDRSFSVYIIPHTFNNTSFKNRQIGDKLNLETDMFAKYVLFRDKKMLSENFLKEKGFI